MPVPDIHAGEPTVEVDPVLFRRWHEAARNAARWKTIAERERRLLEKEIGDAYAGTIDGDKVLTYRPSDKWAGAEIVKQYPDLTQHFMRPQTQEVFDVEAFRFQYPDIAAKFRVRSFRAVEEK